jgi:hypothetical protein
MAEKREDKKSIFQAENVIVKKTMPQGGDVPSIGHVHEERDVPLNSLVKAAIYLVVFTGLISLALWGLFEFFAAQADERDPQLSPLAERRTPPSPRLQSNPAADMARFRQHEDSALAAPGGTNNDGTRRVTVDEAMTMIAERGLPTFPAVGIADTSKRATGATGATADTTAARAATQR